MSPRAIHAEEAEHIRKSVIEVLKKHERRSFAELYDDIGTVNEKADLSNALFRLKQLHAIVQDKETKDYSLAKPGARAPATRTEEPPTATPKAPKAVATPARQPTETQRVLEQLLQNAQQALDDYVYAVGDKQILDHLKAARDAAGAAFQAWLNGTGG